MNKDDFPCSKQPLAFNVWHYIVLLRYSSYKVEMRTCTSNLTSETVPVPLYRSTVSWSKVNFSSKNWPKYRCNKYLHARFFILSDHGRPKYHGILNVWNIQNKLKFSALKTAALIVHSQSSPLLPQLLSANKKYKWRHFFLPFILYTTRESLQYISHAEIENNNSSLKSLFKLWTYSILTSCRIFPVKCKYRQN